MMLALSDAEQGYYQTQNAIGEQRVILLQPLKLAGYLVIC